VRVDDRCQRREGAVHHRVDVLGVELAAHRRRAHHVEKQHADLLQRLARRGGGRRRGKCGQLGAQRDDRGIDERVTQQGR
jgi:hypothetical protein